LLRTIGSRYSKWNKKEEKFLVGQVVMKTSQS